VAAIDAVDLFYLRMPEVEDRADGTQDTFLVRIRDSEGFEGWGESDASPLVSLSAYVCPISHSNIVGLRESIVGERVDAPEDIRRVRAKALRRALDIQQVHHAYSAADIALWDLLGRRLDEPVYRLLDGERARSHPKRPYASSLFGDTPDETRERARDRRDAGFEAAKFGWGPMGRHGRDYDIALVAAAREGLGDGHELMVDAGWAWGSDDATAYERAVDFAEFACAWLEEPLLPEEVAAYGRLSARRPPTPIAAGEASGKIREAEDMLANGGVGVLQIDAGRIGGITPAHDVRRAVDALPATYVNHTFKSHLSLAAALHVFAAAPEYELLEYAVGGSPLAEDLTVERLERRADGLVDAPGRPGLGVTVDPDVVRRYAQHVEITVQGEPIHTSASAI
jgi:L-alanine-DL-glutamate epimerase-like enolase superfamily enzyme